MNQTKIGIYLEFIIKVISILFALALLSCRQSSNQSAPETSTSDSVELKKQEAWESAHRLDSVEALLAEEKNEHDADASASDKPARQYSEHELNAITIILALQ